MERSIALIAIFAALIAALGLMPNLMLATGVPITAQSLGVMLCGTVLGAKRGGLAVLLFVGLVALGLPLLAGGRGGLGVFASPTVGFVVGFPIAAFTTGFVMEQMRRQPVGLAAGVSAAIGGILVLYLFGISGFMMVLGKGLSESLIILGAYIP
ncbi:MAG: biotin transporter BioY, partial [Sulfitobacter sp.]